MLALFAAVAVVQLYAAGEFFKKRRNRAIGVDRKRFREGLKSHIAAQNFIQYKKHRLEDAPQSPVTNRIERRKNGDSQRQASESNTHAINIKKRFVILRIRRYLKNRIEVAADLGKHRVFAEVGVLRWNGFTA